MIMKLFNIFNERRIYMRKKFLSCFSVCMLLLLTLFNTKFVSYATENVDTSQNPLLGKTTSELQAHIDKEKNIENHVTRSFTVSGGGFQDYLSGTDTYQLYPAQLSAGEYLQLRLSVPSDVNINYNLYLYDSSLSNILKASTYLSAVNDFGVLPESIGYIAPTDQTVYICIYSIQGGSTTAPFTLEYTFSSANEDNDETDENVFEAIPTSLTTNGFTATRILNSPIDNDWYSFTVINDLSFSKIRFSITSTSTTNNCQFEVYENLIPNTGYYAMSRLGYGDGGELELDPGTYYVRVNSTTPMTEFNLSDIPEYTLKIAPVSPVTWMDLSQMSGYNACMVTYYSGNLLRIDDSNPNVITITGQARYWDDDLGYVSAKNAAIDAVVTNTSYIDSPWPEKAYSHGSAVTDSTGVYHIYVEMPHGMGHVYYNAPLSVHRYDLMEVQVSPRDNDNIVLTDSFYLLHSPTALYP